MKTLPEFQLASALKAQQWEITKGHMRAVAALMGSYNTETGDPVKAKWLAFETKVEDFIEEVESNGMIE